MANTTFLQIEKFEQRDPNLETHLNERLMDGVDAALGGYISISLAGESGATVGGIANAVALTPTQAKTARVKLTGNPAAALTLLIPSTTGALARIEFVNACGGSSSTVKIKSAGANTANAAGVSILTGQSQIVSHDGESAYYAAAPAAPSTGALVVPRCRLTHSGVQSISHATVTALSFDTETKDNYSLHDTVTNNSRILIGRKLGGWSLFASVRWAANLTGARDIFFRKNGDASVAYGDNVLPSPGSSGIHVGQVLSHDIEATASGDYVELYVYQESGGALNVPAATGQPAFGAHWIGE